MNEVPADVSEVAMARASSLAEVVEEEQRVADHVVDQDERDEEHGRCSKSKSKTFTAIQTAQSTRSFGARSDATSRPAAGAYIVYEDLEDQVHMEDGPDKMMKNNSKQCQLGGLRAHD